MSAVPTTRSFVIFLVHRQLDQRRARDTRFPASLLKNLHSAGSLVRRCFARVLLKMNLVGKESPRCLTLSADRVGVERPGSLSPFVKAEGEGEEGIVIEGQALFDHLLERCFERFADSGAFRNARVGQILA